METRKVIGLAGSAILFMGVFAPILSVPILGNINYFRNGEGDGAIILILAIISLVLVLGEKYRGLWLTGIIALVVMLSTFIHFQSAMSQTKADIDSKLTDNPFRGLADIAVHSVQLQWGWALLIVGAILLIISAAMKDDAA